MAENFRDVVDRTVEENADKFWEVALDFFEHPQIKFEETYASAKCRELLAEGGLEVSQPKGDLPTSFLGTHSTGEGPAVGILCEYDALPVLGHACGHPLIATAGVLAGWAAAKAMDACGVKGTIQIFGTPAEEDGAGKDVMLQAGAFENTDAVLLCHPTTKMTRAAGGCCSSINGTVTFTGAPAQAQSHPDQGINAMDAVALMQAAVGMARQQLPDSIHIALVIREISHDIISIPERAVVDFCVSSIGPASRVRRGLDTIRRIAEGCAIATGCQWSYEEQKSGFYLGRLENETIGAVLREEIRGTGEPCQDGLPIDQGGEDFGNVSRVVPGVQMFGSLLLERKVSGHTEEFKQLAMSEAGRHCMVMCAKSMARTALALMEQPELVEAAKAEMHERLAAENEE